MRTAYLLVKMHKTDRGLEVPVGLGIFSEEHPTVIGPFVYRRITSRTRSTYAEARRAVRRRAKTLFGVGVR